MRTSALSSYLRGIAAMQRIQGQLDQTQQQISTGRRIVNASDDPIGAVNALAYRESRARLEQFDRNANSARSNLEFEETALSTTTNLLQRVRELTVQALNSTNSPEGRGQIGVELQERAEELMQVANQQDATGRFIFAGSRDGEIPVAREASGYVYRGDETERLISIGESRQIFDSNNGADVFFNIRNGNGTFRVLGNPANTGTGQLKETAVPDAAAYDLGEYRVRFVDAENYEVLDSANTVVAASPYEVGGAIDFRGISLVIEGEPAAGDEFQVEPSRNQSMFAAVERMAEALSERPGSVVGRAELHTTLTNGLQELDLALDNVSRVRTDVGVRLQAIDTQLDANGSMSLLADQSIAELEDLDYAEAISRLTQQSALLEATQRSFVQTQRLSLFSFL